MIIQFLVLPRALVLGGCVGLLVDSLKIVESMGRSGQHPQGILYRIALWLLLHFMYYILFVYVLLIILVILFTTKTNVLVCMGNKELCIFASNTVSCKSQLPKVLGFILYTLEQLF